NLRSNLKLINSLPAIAAAFSSGKYSVRLTPSGAPELQKAAVAFNDMAASLERLLIKLSERKKEILDQLGFIEQLLDAIPNPVYYLDGNGQLLGANSAWEEFFNLELKTAKGKSSDLIYHFDKTFADALHESDKLLASRVSKESSSLPMQLANGETKEVVVYKAGFISQISGERGVIAIILDVTDVKNALQDKADAEAASETKSRFLANMSHEMRTPLTAIIGHAEKLISGMDADNKDADSLSIIIRAGKHLSQLINDLLDLSKVEAGKLDMECLDAELNELVAEVYEYTRLHASAKGLQLEVDYRFPLPKAINTDPLRLKQVLINLVNNAIKFTDKGFVKLLIEFDEKTAVLNLCVQDSGIGISKEQQEKLFSPFTQADVSTTRKYGGTGLGLYLSKVLAEKLGGSLALDSEVGKGSCFTLSVPVKSNNALQLVSVLPESGLPQTSNAKTKITLSGKVLLAEDNPVNQELISYFLEDLGLQTTFACNGAQALELATTNQFDVILMDMQMPVMDGIQATYQLRQQNIKTPIIALTANASQEDREVITTAGADDYLLKPIDRVAFANTLAKHLVKEPGEAEDLIISSLIGETDRFKKLVQKFSDHLHGMIQLIDDAYSAQDYQTLKEKVHSLKGVGGNMGFQILTDKAIIIENHIQSENISAIGEEIQGLYKIAAKIARGLMSEPASQDRYSA
ncbi:MAG: response regulator, partial [Gammaproteobacteria bacterium]|nr:response regulator [Gammaproteobacteria bacterium]